MSSLVCMYERKVAKATRDQARTRLGWKQTDEVYRCLDKEVKKSCRTDKQEAQLMLTTGSTRLAVSRGQQTWYHSTCYI